MTENRAYRARPPAGLPRLIPWLLLGAQCLALAQAAEPAAGTAGTAPKVHRAKAAGPPAAPARPSTSWSFGRFGEVTIYRPVGPPRAVVLFLSGDGGWNDVVVEMAGYLVDEGAIVAGLDTPRYLAALGAAGGNCVSLAADFEQLSHSLQRQLGLHDYLKPILVGHSSGATLVYATLAQSPPGTFAGAMSLGFCIAQDLRGAKLCPAPGLKFTHDAQGEDVFAPDPHLRDKWIAFEGQKDEVCDAGAVDTFAAGIPGADVVRLPRVGHGFNVKRNWLPQFHSAFQTLLLRAAPPPPAAAEVGDLPLTVVPVPPAAAGAKPVPERAAFALLLTGDGGWAGLDQDVSAELAAKGLPVVGLSTLRYFWKERTPEETSGDVARIIRHYLAAWNKQSVVLIGYSFGADVLPFVVNRLPPDLRARVESLNLIGLSDQADFEIRVAQWLPGSSGEGRPVIPELAKQHGLPILCFYGEGESDSACPGLAGPQGLPDVRSLRVGTGHHLGGRYDEIADDILASR